MGHAFTPLGLADAQSLELERALGIAVRTHRALTERGVPFLFATGYDRWILPDRFADAPRLEKPVEVNSLAQLLGPMTSSG